MLAHRSLISRLALLPTLLATLLLAGRDVTMAELYLGNRPGDGGLPGDHDLSDADDVQAHVHVVEPLPTTVVRRLLR